MKILVSAYACEPGKGSEAGIGWNWVEQLSIENEIWVITRENNSIPVTKNQSLPQNTHWIYYDLPYYLRFWKKGSRGARVYYYLWQIAIYFKIKKINNKINFDVIQHATFGSYWLPSLLCLLPIPFIWGPVGGGESAPKSLYKSLDLNGKIFEHKRDIVRSLVQFDILWKLTVKRATIALATSEQTKERLHKAGVKNIQIMSNVALPLKDIEKLNQFQINKNPNLIFVSIGRLLHWKGYHLGLKAFAEFLKSGDIHSEYWIVGEGPEFQNLKDLASQLGIQEQTRFMGNLSREEVFGVLKDSDALVHPSFHDSGGWVCAEAMAAGRPVICLDIGGPALQVDENTGYKIPPTNTKEVIEYLKNSMEELYHNTNLRLQFAEACKVRILDNFSWNLRRKEMLQIMSDAIRVNKTI